MKKTDIEYLTHTWNPIVMRCTPCSPGCAACWHLAMCDRLMHNPIIPLYKQSAYAGGEPFLDTYEVMAPLRARKPAIIGTQFMGDLFHPRVKTSYINSIFNVMTNSYMKNLGHTFLILTKRPGTMNKYIHEHIHWESAIVSYENSNVWVGVTTENQEQLGKRMAYFKDVPAKNKFLSVEPMLSPIDITPYARHIKWVIAGAESGPNRRKIDIDHIIDLKNQCRMFNIPFFLKQMDVNGKLVKMPVLDGGIYDQYPEEIQR